MFRQNNDIIDISELIAIKVTEKNFGGLKDLVRDDVVVTKDLIDINDNNNNLIAIRPYYHVPRNGDILVGFYLEEGNDPVEIKITCGGTKMKNLMLYPGECSYFLNKKHMFPIISIQYSEIHINTVGENPLNFTGVSCIFALLQTDFRRLLATSPIIFEGTNQLVVHNHYIKEIIGEERDYQIGRPDSIIEFPDMSMFRSISQQLIQI
jgi:hypothetical protein